MLTLTLTLNPNPNPNPNTLTMRRCEEGRVHLLEPRADARQRAVLRAAGEAVDQQQVGQVLLGLGLGSGLGLGVDQQEVRQVLRPGG